MKQCCSSGLAELIHQVPNTGIGKSHKCCQTQKRHHLLVQVVTLEPLSLMGFGGVRQAALQPLAHITQCLHLHQSWYKMITTQAVLLHQVITC